MDKQENKLSLSLVEVPERSGNIPDRKTIPEVLQYYAEKCPDKDALIFVSPGGKREDVTFKDVYEKSNVVAYNLLALGVQPRETVAINLRTCPEWLYIAFGSMMAGAIPLGVSFTYQDGSDMIALMKKLKTCSCLVMEHGVDGENWSILSKLVESYDRDGNVTSEQMPYLRYLIGHNPEMNMSGVKPLTELLVDNPNRPDLPELQSDDIACLFQTSGSTGIPKTIAHTHASFITTTRVELNVTSDSKKFFNDRPFNWIGGYPFGLMTGTTRVTCSGFESDLMRRAAFVSDVIRQEKCQVVFIPPTLLPAIEALFKDNPGMDWPVESFLAGGNPITEQMLPYIGELCNHIFIVYGGSEFMGVSSLVVTDSSSYKDYNNGHIMPGVSVKVVDQDEHILPLNTRGEIYVKSKSLFREYYNDPMKTAAVFTDDGWYKTDDMGRLTEDGSLFVEGRKSNMIISGRMNVAPEILEAAIEKCPGVEATVVVPVPDDVMYQVICACVKVVPGSGVVEADVRRFCEEFHGDKRRVFTVLPKYYMVLEQFPETTTGKVARKALGAMAEKLYKSS